MAIPLHPTTMSTHAPEEFARMTEREQRAAQYSLSHATHSRLLDLYEGLGAVAGSLDKNTTSNERLAGALELASSVAGGAKKTPSKAPPAPVPLTRDPMPSLLEDKEGDTPTLVNVKAVGRTALQRREEALDAAADELVVAKSDAKRLRRLAIVLGILVSLGVVASGCWVAFRIAVANAVAAQPRKEATP